jgi:hypothetical protein
MARAADAGIRLLPSTSAVRPIGTLTRKMARQPRPARFAWMSTPPSKRAVRPRQGEHHAVEREGGAPRFGIELCLDEGQDPGSMSAAAVPGTR